MKIITALLGLGGELRLYMGHYHYLSSALAQNFESIPFVA